MAFLQSVNHLSQRAAASTERTQVQEITVQGLRAVILQNDFLRATVLTELGGKLASLVNLASGREFFLQPPSGRYTRPVYGAPFEAYDTSGFDECFPTVASCQYPDTQFADVRLPDHGELWSIPWQSELRGNQFRIAASGVRLPYIFRKELSLDGSALRISYELVSISDAPIAYLYSAHPLLNVEPGAHIVLPPEINSMYVQASSDHQLGKHGESCDWPVASADGGTVRLDALVGPELASAHKLFTPRISTGKCGIHFPRTHEALLYNFDPAVLPYIGLWLCQGAWPNAKSGHFTAALEPCSGRPDTLAECFARGEHRILQAHGTHRWSIELRVMGSCKRLAI